MDRIKLFVKLNGEPRDSQNRHKIEVSITNNLNPCIVRLDRLTQEEIDAASNVKKRLMKQSKIYNCEYI